MRTGQRSGILLRAKRRHVAITIGGVALLCGAPFAVASRASSEQAALARLASNASARAQQSLNSGHPRRAIRAAERAVAAMPQSAAYRLQLGQAYLMTGRFISAQAAFSDALALEPDNGAVILKLALTRIALGDAKGARDLLDSQQSNLPVSDYGLALALAGDANAAIGVLVPAVRNGDANATLRQNLALAFALAGRWEDARAMALVDVPIDQVEDRLQQWASIARTDQPWAQVASLLGIAPPADWRRADAGQPQELALVRPEQSGTALAELKVPPMDAHAPASAPAQMDEAVACYEAAPELKDPVISFSPRPLPKAHMLGAKQLAGAARPKPASPRLEGGYVIQIGAFRSAQAAAHSWTKNSTRWGHLQRYSVHQARVQGPKGTYYRLSLGPFVSRSEAGRICASLRAKGGTCFPRALSPQDNVRWAAKRDLRGRQLAMR